MKKNNMLRIASVLLVAVLLSTCAISGAFAKYYTKGEAADSARVARFGFEVTVGGNNAMFGNAYASKTGGNAVFTNFLPEDDAENGAVNAAANAEATSVRAEAKVVAPGTEGSLGGYSITGSAEVDVMVKKQVALTLTGFNDYCPIVIFVGGTPYYVGKSVDEADDAADDIITDVAELIACVNATAETKVDAGEAYPDAGATYRWEWVFDKEDGRLANELKGLVIDDAKDTALGKNSADTQIAMDISVTITQID